MLETNHLRLSEWTENAGVKSECEKNGAVGDGDGEKEREQHEKVVNNFMQIKGEQ